MRYISESSRAEPFLQALLESRAFFLPYTPIDKTQGIRTIFVRAAQYEVITNTSTKILSSVAAKWDSLEDKLPDARLNTMHKETPLRESTRTTNTRKL